MSRTDPQASRGMFAASGLLPSLVPGVFSGFLIVVLSTSFAALIFDGALSGHISKGIAIAISAAVIVGLGVTVFSRCSPSIAMADEDTAPVYALLLSLVVSSMPPGATAAELYSSAIMAILVTTVLSGLGLGLLGYFRFGSLIQYLPHSVIGGYFAAVGWLLLIGGLQVAIGMMPASLTDLRSLLNAESLLSWIPAVLLLVWLLSMRHRIPRRALLPSTIIAAIVLWYLVGAALNYDPAELMAAGLLVGPFPAENHSLLQPFHDLKVAAVSWRAVFSHTGVIAAIFLISLMSMVLTISGLSLLSRSELDMDRELKIAGFSNVASGFGGGMTALQSYSLSALAMDMDAPRSSWPGLLALSVAAGLLVLGLDLIAYLPRFALGGLLMFLGARLLKEWLIDSWWKFSQLEYLVIPIILATSVAVGFLEGIFVGVMASIVLFVVKYSRSKVVRFVATGAELRSNVDRDAVTDAFIRDNADQTIVLGLQGYLFFGTAWQVYQELSLRSKDSGERRMRYAVLDLSKVTGLDASAALNFQRMVHLAYRANFILALAGLERESLNRLSKGGFSQAYEEFVVIEEDLDRALEWCEDDLLTGLGQCESGTSCFDRLRPYLASEGDLELFIRYLKRREVQPHTSLTRQGDESRELFFMESGAANAIITDTNGAEHRVRRTRQGTVYGEMGFYLGKPRTATVITDEPCVVYLLDYDALSKLESEHPQIAGAFHRYMVVLISERLRFTTRSFRALLA